MVLCKYIVACLVLCIAFASMHALLASLAVFREAVKPHCLSDCTAGPSVPAHPTNSSRPTFLETTPQPDPPRLFLPGPHDPAEGGEEPEPDPAFIPEEETEEQPEEGPEYCAAWLERLRTGGDPPEAVRDGLPRNMTYVVESHYRQWSDTRDHLATRFAQDAMPSGLRLLRALGTLLPQLVSFLEHHHIAYWLDWGTLLGSWRYKDFIPWDSDGDVGIPFESLPTIVARVAQHRFACDCVLVVRHNITNIDIPLMFVDRATGVYVDVFIYRRVGLHYTNKNYTKFSPLRVPYDYVVPTRACELAGHRYQCPGRTVDYLLNMYHDLRPPPEYWATHMCWVQLRANGTLATDLPLASELRGNIRVAGPPEVM